MIGVPKVTTLVVVQEIRAPVVVKEFELEVGVPMVAGVALSVEGVTVLLATLAPAMLFANTLKLYLVEAVKPVTVYEVVVGLPIVFQFAPTNC